MARIEEILKTSAAGWLLVFMTFLVSWYIGFKHLNIVDTDHYSERSHVLSFALDVINGVYAWYRYNTNPYGPGYVAIPFVKMGLGTLEQLRFVPLTLSAFAIAYFSASLLTLCRRVGHVFWVMLFTMLFITQPAFSLWQGALHEHSYSMSTVLITAGACLRYSKLRWVLFISGLLGMLWGYHFIPGHFLSILTMRWVFHAILQKGERLIEAAQRTLIDSSYLLAGMAASFFFVISTGAYQLGGYGAVFRDWLGRLATRADLGLARDLNGGYFDYVNEALKNDVIPSRLEILYQYFRFLFDPTMYYGMAILIALVIWYMPSIVGYIRRLRPKAQVQDRWALLFAIAGAFLASTLWGLALPKHFVMHQWFLTRHLLAGFMVLSVLPLTLLEPIGLSWLWRKNWTAEPVTAQESTG